MAEPGSAVFDTGARPRDAYDKESIGEQLDAFSQKHKLKSLRDRLRIGLNEVAILAFEKTNQAVQGMVEKMADSPEARRKIYDELVNICVGMQEAGPWGYTEGLANPESPEMKAWFMLTAAETVGYERERDLNDAEFVDDVKRIEGHLAEATRDPEGFFATAKEHLLKKSEQAIRFDPDDKDNRVPIGEGFASFLSMAIKGYEAGVVQDAEGWVFVGARGEISDSLIESTGLKKEVGPDDRNPRRTVTYFVNEQGQKLIKKLHSGLLIILSRSFDLATAVVKALNDEQEVIKASDDALGHIRVVQTTEKARGELGIAEQGLPKGFMRVPEVRPLTTELAATTELMRPREEFYRQLLHVRGNYVYMDALNQLMKRRAEQGKEVSKHDKEVLWRKTSEKMEQKVDELRHVNGLIDQQLDTMPEGVRSVIDMAGGAGDLGLAVTSELLSRGKEVDHTKIVDPQEGVAEFMATIIDHLPFRQRLEEIAEHNTGFLQDAEITPDSMVVAKHACGTLTDDILEMWRESESPMLVAMTCCQGKAKEHPARYGFSQKEWDDLCAESDLTNIQIPEAPGKARDSAFRRLERGNRAMRKLDMARVEYLRRHGFKAELSTTDKFPKGDVIIARRLPKNFNARLKELQDMERSDPLRFDTTMMMLDVLAAGGKPKGLDLGEYGEGWGADDFAELTRRFILPAYEEFKPVEASEQQPTAPEAGQPNKDGAQKAKDLMRAVFADEGGRVDLFIQNRVRQAGKTIGSKQFGPLVWAIRNRIERADGQSAAEIRASVDALMAEMGY
jgi:hypothetical protein